MEALFRFIMIRPPETIDDEDVTDIEADTEFQKDLQSNDGGDDGNGEKKQEKIKSKAQEFAKTDRFVRNIDKLAFGQKLEDLNNTIKSTETPTYKSVAEAVDKLFYKKPADLIKTEDFYNDKNKLADSIIAVKMARSEQSPWIKHLARLFKIYTLIERIAEVQDDSLLEDPVAVENHLNGMLRLPSWLFPFRQGSSGSPLKETDREKERKERYKNIAKLRQEKRKLIRAINEMSSFGAQDLNSPQFEITIPTGPPRIYNGLIQKGLRFLGLTPRKPKLQTKPSIEVDIPENAYALIEPAIERLSDETKEALSDQNIDPKSVPLGTVVNHLEQIHSGKEAHYQSLLSREATSTTSDTRNVSMIGSTFIPSTVGDKIPGWAIPGWGVLDLEVVEEDFAPLPGIPSTHGNLQPIGVMDLLVLKQNLKLYEAGEVSHIENVLKGESKSREHRRARETEEFLLEEIVTTKEEERDLQSTERFELKREAEETIKTDASLKAGVTVSGKYGPSVEFKTYADGAITNAKTESQKQAATFAKDITDRSALRVSERVRLEQTLRITEEFEEQTKHGLENTTSDKHIIGIYQWIDKIYEAQIYNYGVRTLYDIMIPEPASFLIAAMKTNLGETAGIEAPEPFDTPASEITKDNYNDLAAKYNLSGMEPPPEFEQNSSKSFSGTSNDPDERDANFPSQSQEVTIPDGYKAVRVFVNNSHFVGWDESQLGVMVGSRSYTFTWTSPSVWSSPLDNETGSIAITFSPWHMSEFAAVVEITFQRTDHAFEDWQNKTHEKIMQAYLQRKSEYENKLASAETEEGIQIQGRNPLENRAIERDELKKACISMLTHQHFDHFGAIETGSLDYPQIDLNEAEVEAAYIRFFEQAFEWEQMMYLLYPYFWSRKTQWVEKLQIQDTDPLHAEFLKAGEARVVLAVREGFESAVAHFMETGEIWSGGDAPDDISSPLYVDIIQEIKERQQAPLDEEAHGDPWDVRLPTTLVKLREDAQLPKWKKDASGNWVPEN